MRQSIFFPSVAVFLGSLWFFGCSDDGETTSQGAGGSGDGGSAGFSGTGGASASGGSGGTGGTGASSGASGFGGEGGIGGSHTDAGQDAFQDAQEDTGEAGNDASGEDVSEALYSVGGSVVSLAGSGLVLQNNGNDDLPIAAEGAFEFATSLPSGAAYQVSVATQPTTPSQVCTVENSAGTIATGDVVDVLVLCETQAFQVGGWVSGLLGTGLVLQNEGGDDLPVAANGPFVFPTAVLSGALYEITVLTQPTVPTQVCTVQNGSGTVGGEDVESVVVECVLPDSDSDGIPDIGDPFPNDPNRPGTAALGTVYAHTASRLFTMDVVTFDIQEIGLFNGSEFSGSVTDVAVSEFGVLYAVTFNDLYVCHPMTAECWKLASLPTSFNGLTMVPPGVLDPIIDTLVGIANNGSWYRMDVGSGQAQLTLIGSYGSGYTSSGDAFSIEGVGTYGAVNKSGESSVVIVEVEPATGAVISELATLTGYYGVYGLAGWDGAIFAFDVSGAVLRVDPATGAYQLIHSTPHSWWGAGVTTKLDQ